MGQHRDGVYIPTDGWANMSWAMWTALIRDWRVMIPQTHATKKDVVCLKVLTAAGQYRPVIDHGYPLEQVGEATQYVETEQKTGNVVLTVDRDRRC